jgi:hypothetical protein
LRALAVAALPAELMALLMAEVASVEPFPRAGFTEYPPYGFPAGSQTVAGRVGSASPGMPPGMPGFHTVPRSAGMIPAVAGRECARQQNAASAGRRDER